jgi:glycosyltransferase involved in cell wall biosynthesis
MSNKEFTITIGENVSSEKPNVSVIIPNYNTARYIAETLDSVLTQTFKSIEIIVINDGAPDTEELKNVLEPYLQRITFINCPMNEGTSRARNLAAAHARADVLAFLDGDDIWKPTFLEELYKFLTEYSYDMVYADAEAFGKRYLTDKDYLRFNPAEGEITRAMLIEGKCHILPSGTLIRKDVFSNVGGFDPAVRRTEDFDLWMRLLFSGARIGYRRKLLFKFRIRPDSGSGDYLVRLERCIDVWHILRKKLEFTPAENAIIDRHIAVQQSALLRAKGRCYLNQRNWPAARMAFREAKSMADSLSLPLKHRLKLSGVIMALDYSPNLVYKIFRKIRPHDVEYMSGN